MDVTELPPITPADAPFPEVLWTPPGLRDLELTEEQAEIIRKLLDDPNVKTHEGVDLPKMTAEEFLELRRRKAMSEPITPAELQAMKEFCDSNPRHKYAFFAMDGGEIGPRVDVPRLIAEVERHQWRPISEAPKDGTRILVDDMVSRRCEIAYWDVDAGGWLTKDGDRSCGPTDFMPLPPPPIPPGDKT